MSANNRIETVHFAVKSDANIVAESTVLVKSNGQFRDGLPVPNGVYDLRMGVSVAGPGLTCGVCRNSKYHCPGHPGSIELAIPIVNSLANSKVVKWLNVVCHHCGNFPRTIEPGMTLDRLGQKVNKSGSKLKNPEPLRCIKCNNIQPSVTNAKVPDLKKISFITRTRNTSDNRPVERVIYGTDVKTIFSRVGPDQPAQIGEVDHPSKFILHYLQIPSVACRPPVSNPHNKNSNDITSFISNIITQGAALKSESNKDKKEKLAIRYASLCLEYLVKSGEGDSSTSLLSALKTKKGLLRGMVMSKTTEAAFRAVIICNDKLPPNVACIPQRFAKANCIPIRVWAYNLKRMAQFVMNGKEYPGVVAVIRDGQEQRINESFQLQLGDIVKRHIIEGDCAIFGRNPSLTDKSVSSLYVKINPDLGSNAIEINVTTVESFSGDFDGDQMSGKFLENIAARVESLMVMGFARDLQYVKSGTPVIGQMQDTILGVALLTTSRVRVKRSVALHLLRNCQKVPELPAQEHFTGRELVSLFLPPINYSRPSKFAEIAKLYAFNSMDKDDMFIKIRNGKILSGVLDGSAIKTSRDSIFMVVLYEYGPQKMLECVHDIQQVAIAFLRLWGATVGLMDFVVKPETQERLDEEEDKILAKYLHYVQLLTKGALDPPVGIDTIKFYEECQVQNLNAGDAYDAVMFQNAGEDNNMVRMIVHGSKGNMSHLKNFVGSIGLVSIVGGLMPQKLSHSRSTAFFARYSMDPASRAYVSNSLFTGFTPVELHAALMAARFDITCRSLSTADTGKLNRIGNKTLESICTTYFFSSVNGYDGSVIQMRYGDDGFNPRSLEDCKIEMVFMGDADFGLIFRLGNTEAEKKLFDLCTKMRLIVRNGLKRIHWARRNSMINNYFRLPFNVRRIVGNVIGMDAKDLARPELATLIQTTLEYVGNFGSHYFGPRTPRTYHKCASLMQAALLDGLVPNLAKMTTENLRNILAQISIRFLRALTPPGVQVGILAAQSLSEPLSQYMLDATHGSIGGGTKKDSIKIYENLGNIKSESSFSNAGMALYPKNHLDEAHVNKLANAIEETKIGHLVVGVMSYVFGEDVLMIPFHSEYLKKNPIFKPKKQASHYFVKVELSAVFMFDKSVGMTMIVDAIYRKFGETVLVVPSPQTEARPFFHVIPLFHHYDALKAELSDCFNEFNSDILNVSVKGVSGIIRTNVRKLVRNDFGPNGLVNLGGFFIETSGVNAFGVLAFDELDHNLTLFNVPDTNCSLFGIGACRASNITETKKILALQQNDVHWHHFSNYADSLTYTGRQTGISAKGLRTREPGNVILQATFKNPTAAITMAANSKITNQVRGLSAAMVVGTIPRIGTEYFKLFVNVDFVKRERKSVNVEDLFD
jgi:DNA-directed RNA polymerase II subunit RPB1